MRILWCERHNLKAEDSEHCEDGTEDAPRDDWCVVVPMRLIPDNDETVRACETCGGRGFYPDGDQLNCIVCLGSGLVAALDGETP